MKTKTALEYILITVSIMLDKSVNMYTKIKIEIQG